VHVGVLYTTVRRDEKLLFEALRDRDHEVTTVDAKRTSFDLSAPPADLADVDVVLDRCVSTSQSRYVSRFAAAYDLPVVNDPQTAAVCADKVRTSLALAEAGVPTPTTRVAFSEAAALDVAAELGYPCVLKPVVGSWGRLMAKLDSPSAAEAVFEHKATLGHYEHSVFYLQSFVDKPGRDVRVVAVDGDPVAAMTRSADDWLTNASRGAETEPFGLDDTVTDLVSRASAAVGGGLLGVDLMETGPNDDVTGDGDGYVVHEVNHTVEFKALDGTVDADVPGRVVDWLETIAEGVTA
jgi:[lysine-biosynthesis-protein LysW]--L-2-aminoadipate ligase